MDKKSSVKPLSKLFFISIFGLLLFIAPLKTFAAPIDDLSAHIDVDGVKVNEFSKYLGETAVNDTAEQMISKLGIFATFFSDSNVFYKDISIKLNGDFKTAADKAATATAGFASIAQKTATATKNLDKTAADSAYSELQPNINTYNDAVAVYNKAAGAGTSSYNNTVGQYNNSLGHSELILPFFGAIGLLIIISLVILIKMIGTKPLDQAKSLKKKKLKMLLLAVIIATIATIISYFWYVSLKADQTIYYSLIPFGIGFIYFLTGLILYFVQSGRQVETSVQPTAVGSSQFPIAPQPPTPAQQIIPPVVPVQPQPQQPPIPTEISQPQIGHEFPAQQPSPPQPINPTIAESLPQEQPQYPQPAQTVEDIANVSENDTRHL